MQLKTLRPVADSASFPEDLMRRFAVGGFAREFERRGLKILSSEVMNEVRRLDGAIPMTLTSAQECTYRIDAPKEEAGLRDRIGNLYL